MSSALLTRSKPVSGSENMDPRLRARRVEIARDRGRRRVRRTVALAAVTVLVLGAVAATRSPLLDVDAVSVNGSRHSGEAATLDAAGIAPGRPMTSVDLAAAEARLEQMPWVAAAEVSRQWPGTVRIRVTERSAVAVAGQGIGALLVDRHGRLLGPASGDEELPTVVDDPRARPGGELPPARRAVVALLADLPASLRSEVAQGMVTPDGLGLVLQDGIRVRLGDRTRLRAKSDAVELLLAEADRASIASIDVAVPAAPALTRDPPKGA